MADTFNNYRTGLESSFSNLEAADFSATDFTFSTVPRGLICATFGSIKVDTLGGNIGVTVSVQPGVNPIRVTKIYNVGSDAVSVVGGW